jgi:hypothetical protein
MTITLTALNIAGRRWFQKSYGNTYHSVQVTATYSDGSTKTLRSGKRYGYDDHYIQTAIELLIAEGILSAPSSSDVTSFMPLSLFCRNNGIEYANSVADVSRERDL